MRVFRSVIASGSVVAAADHLRLTSSAVSQHLAALQQETGLTLFHRSGRGIVPTQAALVLARESDSYLASWEHLRALVADLREGHSSHLSLGYFASAGTEWMPRLVRLLTAEFPDLVLDLALTETGPTADPPDVDLSIGDPDQSLPDGFSRTTLAEDVSVAVLPADHELADRTEIALTDLRGERWIRADRADSPDTKRLLRVCTALGFRPRFPIQADDHVTAMGFVQAGLGVAVIPALAAAAHPPGTTTVPLSPPAPMRTISAVVRDLGAPHPPSLRAVALLREIVARPRPRR